MNRCLFNKNKEPPPIKRKKAEGQIVKHSVHINREQKGHDSVVVYKKKNLKCWKITLDPIHAISRQKTRNEIKINKQQISSITRTMIHNKFNKNKN